MEKERVWLTVLGCFWWEHRNCEPPELMGSLHQGWLLVRRSQSSAEVRRVFIRDIKEVESGSRNSKVIREMMRKEMK